MVIRLGATLALLFSVLFLPWIITVIFGIILVLYFENYFEAIIIFLISDLLYGVDQTRFINISFISTLIAAILFISIEFLKRKLKFYQQI